MSSSTCHSLRISSSIRMKTNETNMNNEVASNNKAILDQNNIPIEQLFGSVTTYNNVEGSESKSQQLRTSARVFKKMKLDSVVPSCVVLETKKEEIKPEVKRLWRPTWSQEDKNLFFEALNEYGKDFESIYYYISNKLRRKGLPESVMKTKDQIRHFYYRTWHKISKHLKFGDAIKKNAQELYGLVNYGELRKKIGSVSEKTCMKLNELIYRGGVAIRSKGKTIRIKTPMCRALRNLNQLDEKHDDLKLPTRVIVNLVPKDMNAWLKVQGVAQNPRVKAALPLQRRLSTLINHLSCKWRSVNEIVYDNILSAYNSTTDYLPENKPEDNKATLDQFLRLSPPPKANIEFPTVNLSEYLTSQSICLNAFEERIGVTTPGEQLWIPKGGLKKTGTKRSRNDSTNDKLPNTFIQKALALCSTSIDTNENCIGGNDDLSSIKILATETASVPPLQTVENVEEKVDEIKIEDIKEENEKKLQDISNIRKGWTSQNCGTVTIGELYIMFGSNANLTLEYSWDNLEKITPKVEVDLEESASADEKVPSESVSDASSQNETFDNNLSGTLQRLLSIAKLHYRKNIVRCPCGHTCGTTKSNNIVNEKPVNTKSNKTLIGEKSVDSSEKISTADSGAVVNTTVVSSVVPIIIQSPHQPVTVFRQPIAPNLDSFRAQLNSIQRLTPKYCNRRGRRPRSKQVVVERRLPLLPNTMDNEHQIVQMNIISPNNINHGPRLLAPKILNIDKSEHNISNTVSVALTPIETESVSDININFGAGETNISGASTSGMLDITDNAVTPSRVGSPTSISNLLDIALATSDVNLHQDLEGRDDSGVPSFMGFLSSSITNSTPPTSPSRILKENDNQWLNSEVADFSLSSFLGHLESPIKTSQISTVISNEDTRMSQDVDAQLQSLLTDSSVDYMAKFADLAAQVDQHK